MIDRAITVSIALIAIVVQPIVAQVISDLGCPTCLPGEGQQQNDNNQCTCVPCGLNEYSKNNKCELCDNLPSCEAISHKITEQQCTRTSNTQCGDCEIGYMLEREDAAQCIKICPSCDKGTEYEIVGTSCRCIPCESGYYAENNRCRPCDPRSCERNLYRKTIFNCTGETNTLCGRCLDGYDEDIVDETGKSCFLKELSCGLPPAVANAMLNSTSLTMTYRSFITYQCSPGYWFQPFVYSYTSICQYDATWTYTPPCTELICDSTPVVANAVLESTNMKMTYQSRITYHCLPDFWFQPNVYNYSSTCQDNATWTQIPPCVNNYKALQDNEKWTQYIDKIESGSIGAIITLLAVVLAILCYKFRNKIGKGRISLPTTCTEDNKVSKEVSPDCANSDHETTPMLSENPIIDNAATEDVPTHQQNENNSFHIQYCELATSTTTNKSACQNSDGNGSYTNSMERRAYATQTSQSTDVIIQKNEMDKCEEQSFAWTAAHISYTI